MMMYYAKQLVELNKCQGATAAVSNLRRTDIPKSDVGKLSGRENLKFSEENILSLGGKVPPNLTAPKSMFQTREISSRISHRS
jgi:hypothetical protein